MKRTAIVGATMNSTRYAYLAAAMLAEKGHEIVPLGIKKGEVQGLEILDITTFPKIDDVDTITIYINARRQTLFYEYLIGLNPNRIIFNPGTENPVFEKIIRTAGIKTERACTLVLLSTGMY